MMVLIERGSAFNNSTCLLVSRVPTQMSSSRRCIECQFDLGRRNYLPPSVRITTRTTLQTHSRRSVVVSNVKDFFVASSADGLQSRGSQTVTYFSVVR